MKKIITILNVPHHICHCLIGKKHKFIHRAFTGVGIMVGGVIIAKTIGHHELMYIAIVGDTIGYGMHGIGLIPFVEGLLGLEKHS